MSGPESPLFQPCHTTDVAIAIATNEDSTDQPLVTGYWLLINSRAMTNFSWPEILGTLGNGSDLTREQAGSAMREVMAGKATPAQIAGLIVALRMKGETVEEMGGLVDGMLEAAVRVELGDSDPVDIVGTGGDRSGTFNISTTASLIAAGAGIPIAKHGNRSMSSKCGSADVLEALGVVIDLPVEQNRRLFHDTGYAFFLAPVYHPAMRHAGPVRKELGIPTVFNFLGPLSNPAGVGATRWECRMDAWPSVWSGCWIPWGQSAPWCSTARTASMN